MTYDVVVVGAGPAGATAAKFLAEKGVKTLLIDKRMYPRDKPCGGVLSVRTLKRFPYISDDLIDSYSFGGSITSSSLMYKVQLQKEKPIAAFVLRKNFDQGLVKRAIQSGTTFRDGTAAVDIQRRKDVVKISLNDGESIESQLVIGADGIWSTVAKNSGLGQHYPRIGRCLFQEYPLASNLLDQYFSEKRLFQFYLKFMGIDGIGWVFPKKDSVNIGIGEIQPLVSHPTKRPHLKEAYNNYLLVLKEKKMIPPTIKGGTIQGGVLPLHPLEKTFADRVVLCGDAAGLMNPLTGDGIHYAMSSGKFAAEVCTEALEADDTSAVFLSKYQRLWKDDFGEEITLCAYILKRILKHGDEKYIKLLSKDTQIVDMLLYMVNNQVRIHDYKWKLVKRFISIYFKDILGV
ncbi:MAG: NAD(P)/FAD-dependent oxidoreductase [Thermoplasmata archaeon]|nr:NAD(P)/FAD-dependent oxidoreductase [Thermoplasmata archaeon]MBE3139351.1 NAD(P)/FAD-dependent oxidoreductase [Thermoplasmata archaeon]